MRKKLFLLFISLLMMSIAWAESEPSVSERLYGLGYAVSPELSQEALEKALRGFQTGNGLTVTGSADEATLTALTGGQALSCEAYLKGLALRYRETELLMPGTSGEAVTSLQKKLRELGFFTENADGVYGEETEEAVKRYQELCGLKADGIADGSLLIRLYEGEPLTEERYVALSVCTEGDSGARVRRIQYLLSETGCFQGESTGVYGALTREAVCCFQAERGLEVTGEVDTMTCKALYAAAHDNAHGLMALNAISPEVEALQSRLTALGWFERNITGAYGETTVSAVGLFQMACGLKCTGEADSETLAKLYAEDAPTLDAARKQLDRYYDDPAEGTAEAIAAEALTLRGQPFPSDDEDLYRGFLLTQYLCVKAGIPLTAPEDLTRCCTLRSGDPEPGDILEYRDGEKVYYAVCTKKGYAAYAVPESGFVLESPLSVLSGEVMIWSF